MSTSQYWRLWNSRTSRQVQLRLEWPQVYFLFVPPPLSLKNYCWNSRECAFRCLFVRVLKPFCRRLCRYCSRLYVNALDTTQVRRFFSVFWRFLGILDFTRWLQNPKCPARLVYCLFSSPTVSKVFHSILLRQQSSSSQFVNQIMFQYVINECTNQLTFQPFREYYNFLILFVSCENSYTHFLLATGCSTLDLGFLDWAFWIFYRTFAKILLLWDVNCNTECQ